jgi:type VI secretion system secreted protein Hcp
MATERWFLKLDGITGESTDSVHKGEIDVQAWTYGVSHTQAPAPGGGGGAGKATFQDFHFVTRISKASPQLFLACAAGTHIKQANLTGVRVVGKGKGNEFLKFKLRDVTVTSVQHADSEDGQPSEQFSLNFAKFEMSYFPQDPTGTLGGAVTAAFDLNANKKL